MKIFNSVIVLLLLFTTGCKKFLEIPLPVNQIAGEGAFLSDNSAGAVATGNLTDMFTSNLFGGQNEIPLRAALYVDDLNNLYTTSPQHQAYFTDNLQSPDCGQWTSLYTRIFKINTTIEGLNASGAVLENRNQWLGESYFLRAYMYFHLVNLFGDAPLAITSDFKVNNVLPRAPQADVYKQIIEDLKLAQGLLSEDYRDGYGQSTSSRTRPNKGTATALLARAYLYTKDWVNAEAQASAVINQSATYQLAGLDSVFRIGSTETLWEMSIVPGTNSGITSVYEYSVYNGSTPSSFPADKTPFNYGVPFCMHDDLRNAFEPGDNRFAKWVRPVVRNASDTSSANTYYLIYKYKSLIAAGAENSVQMRLAEQYLIRAEARAHQGSDLAGAKADIDVVRARAGLEGTAATGKEALVTAVIQERRVELFTEGGHRFFDLKRTGTIDAVMAISAVQKGGTWNTDRQVWPINSSDIVINPNLVQNHGYQ